MCGRNIIVIIPCLVALVCDGMKLNTTQEPLSDLVFPPPPYGNYTHYLFSAVEKKERGAECKLPLEIVIVQDATAGNEFVYEQFAYNQSRILNDKIRQKHPDSRVGVWGFRDKPHAPHGDYGDYCQILLSPLYPLNSENVREAYTYLSAAGGADFPENQLGAIIGALQSPTMRWSENSIKVIFLVTDSYPHHADDKKNTTAIIPFSGKIDWMNENAQCDHEYYPSFNQTYDAFKEAGAYFGALLIAKEPAANSVRSAWQWFSNFLGQTTDFVASYDYINPNLAQHISTVVEKIQQYECHTA